MKEKIANLLSQILNMKQEEVEDLLEYPPTRDKGDIALPCFKLAKTMKQNPAIIAANLQNQLNQKNLNQFGLSQIDVVGGYLNFFYERMSFTKQVLFHDLNGVLKENKTMATRPVVIEYSSPNIAKHFKLYHIRSTMIGQSLANIHEALGYDVKKINHLGDWGTQFGKLMAAYKKWGDKTKVESDPINELVKLYVKFHEVTGLPAKLEKELDDLQNGEPQAEAFVVEYLSERQLKELPDELIDDLKKKMDEFKNRKKTEEEIKIFKEKEQVILSKITVAKIEAGSLENEGRYWFKKLENGDKEALELWHWFKDESMNVFENLYKELNVQFDYVLGESFYSDKMQLVLDKLNEKGLLKESEGAKVVPLDDFGMIPCMIQKSDGTSIYATRDLAAAMYREEQFHPEKMLYVVDERQSLHFKQIFEVLKLMDNPIGHISKHVAFGIMKVNGETGSTRSGKGLLLEDVLNNAFLAAKEMITINKNTQVKDSDVDTVAKQIAHAAIIFHDLKHNPSHEINFIQEEALSFEGKTGPYLQYTNARIQSLLSKQTLEEQSDISALKTNSEAVWNLVYHLNNYPDVLHEAVKKNDPSQVARFLIELAQLFNHFYAKERVITDNRKETQSKLLLCEKVSDYLKHGLSMLCIEAPKKL